ncbi:AAEL017267-PA [Aedes aegypti]|uniref:AAEL017267-PA n=1 Tax=Aedes aegypti TaxID=7159 RepID=J9EBM8_AEDAE|nr:AAEL017267-PA [Aedes aegypti]
MTPRKPRYIPQNTKSDVEHCIAFFLCFYVFRCSTKIIAKLVENLCTKCSARL